MYTRIRKVKYTVPFRKQFEFDFLSKNEEI